MAHLEIDPDVHDYLRSNVRDFGETVSVVLRRLLNLPVPREPEPATHPINATQGGKTGMAEVAAALRTAIHRSATDRFLDILASAHKNDQIGFEKVLQVRGRRRMYFARSHADITRSGTSTHPRRIPDSDYWVMTNADTRQKCDMLRRALKLLGYSHDDIRAACDAVF